MALSALVLAVALLSGCGGSGSTSTVGAGDRSAGPRNVSDQEVPIDAKAPAVAGSAVLKVGATPAPVIVDADGMTVYAFRRDDPMLYQFSRSPVPTCYGACSANWAPLLTEERPRAKAGADAAMVGTIKRRDGDIQVTYAGHPLYLFTGDQDPGDVNGQEADSFGARWHAVERDGDTLVGVGR